MAHQSHNPLKSTSKGQFLRDFLLRHDYFAVSSKIGVFKKSKFEFLDPKSTIKGGLRFSFKKKGGESLKRNHTRIERNQATNKKKRVKKS
ncbi:hypothetical protein MTR67_011745 [Solanum verrucosum]|uniref:Uncharacterized protein n=1 Tax=Solanum verrucosum TaxID=315347 RepID=A0AAF0QBP8_SOLVR|nr:hypothetical protein MTR67_011745 [Solanum verrucosum]